MTRQIAGPYSRPDHFPPYHPWTDRRVAFHNISPKWGYQAEIDRDHTLGYRTSERWPARPRNQSLGCQFLNPFCRNVMTDNHGKDVLFSDAPGNELRVLRPKSRTRIFSSVGFVIIPATMRVPRQNSVGGRTPDHTSGSKSPSPAHLCAKNKTRRPSQERLDRFSPDNFAPSLTTMAA